MARQYHSLLEELFRQVQSAVNNGMKMQSDALKVQVRLNESELSLRRVLKFPVLFQPVLQKTFGRYTHRVPFQSSAIYSGTQILSRSTSSTSLHRPQFPHPAQANAMVHSAQRWRLYLG